MTDGFSCALDNFFLAMSLRGLYKFWPMYEMANNRHQTNIS